MAAIINLQPGTGGARKLIATALFVIQMANIGALVAEDRVVIQAAGAAARTVIHGEIDDYTGAGLTIRNRATQNLQRFTSEEVLEVRTDQLASQQQGLKSLASGKITQARGELLAALAQERREWVRREILAGLLRCELWTGITATAGKTFALLVESDRKTIHQPLAPLVWSRSPPQFTATDLELATGWLRHAEPRIRLLGASWLLFNRQMEAVAIAELRGLSRDADVIVQRLAQCQLWRTRPVDETISFVETRQWEVQIDDLPGRLRGGPAFLLGQAFYQRREFESAAAAWLWLPVVHAEHRPLVTEATFLAARSLEQAGQPTAARSLYREVVERDAESPFAMEAKQKLAIGLP